jgi:hypothetical protein
MAGPDVKYTEAETLASVAYFEVGLDAITPYRIDGEKLFFPPVHDCDPDFRYNWRWMSLDALFARITKQHRRTAEEGYEPNL